MLCRRGLAADRSWLVWLCRAVFLALPLFPLHARADAERSFPNEIACSKGGLGPGDCRRAFLAARAEYLSKTRAYPSRFACYRAFGPCMPWPAGSNALGQFRPQMMGITLHGSSGAWMAQPVLAPGRIKIVLASRALSDVAVLAAITPPRQQAWSAAASGPLCRQIETVAAKAHLPPAFLARLLWQESSFRANVVSPAGALGIAQFMPATAQERGLDDPFDAERAIETSANLLSDLTKRFGNLGLAAAAYNGGPARVSGWLKGQRGLAAETEDYVQRVTGLSVNDWATGEGHDIPALTGPCTTVKSAKAP